MKHRHTATTVEVYLEWDDTEADDASALLEDSALPTVRREVLEQLDEYVTATADQLGIPVYLHVFANLEPAGRGDRPVVVSSDWLIDVLDSAVDYWEEEGDSLTSFQQDLLDDLIAVRARLFNEEDPFPHSTEVGA